MNTGTIIPQHNFPKRTFQVMGTAICLVVVFMLGWSVHAYVAIGGVDTGIITHKSLFSPNGGARDAILSQIGQAQNEILVALYYFTDPLLAEGLITAKNRGVTVQVILDRSQKTGRYSQAKRLTEAGIPIHFDLNHRIFHHKFMVVDNRIVITGSQNWTKSAETVNAENTLILQGDTDLIQNYRSEFYRLLSL